MKSKRTSRYLELFAIAIIIFLLVTFSYYLSTRNVFDMEKNPESVHNITISINTPYWNISHHVESTNNTTIASLLFQTAEFYNFSVEKEFWPGYQSYFIKRIGNLTNGMDNRYWQYYVNNEYADKGCSTYYLMDNDSIHWSFEQSSW